MSVFVIMMAVYYSVHSSLVLFILPYHIPFYSYISIQEQECAYIFIYKSQFKEFVSKAGI
jgi:hypothetical protein